VLTGVSGSGKSSLAFDTIYAEGQRRYIESLSVYARQFLDQLERPDVDEIEGLPPTVSIDQKAGAANPRSTVATVTEVHDYLRLLYARAGAPHCPACGAAIRRQTPEQMVASVLALRAGRKVLILAPLVRGRKGLHAEAFAAVRKAGLIRARVDGQVVEVAETDPKLAKTKVHTVEAVVDRLVVREGIRPRLAESIDRGLKLGDGTLTLSMEAEGGGAWEDATLSVRFACPDCGLGFEELEPRTFSFNSPYGACPACDGLGTTAEFDPDLVVPDHSLSIARGAVAPGRDRKGGPSPAKEPWVNAFLKRHGMTRATPLSSWPAGSFEAFWNGTAPDPGLLAALRRELAGAKSAALRTDLESYRSAEPCPACHGARLRPEARAVTLGGRSLPELAEMPVGEASMAVRSLSFPADLEGVGPPLVREVVSRLAFLEEVGLGYLTLARPTNTLSGGELQRVRLATQVGSGLVGVCYVLDEPTAGLHPHDTGKLLDSLRRLRDEGNSVVVVEHDEETIRAADWVIDVGPGAGPDGGLVVALGPPEALVETGAGPSLTARYLDRLSPEPTSGGLNLRPGRGSIRFRGVTERNLKGLDVEVPLGTFCCVAGVSGSGKSTLVHEVIARAVGRSLGLRGPRPGIFRVAEGLDLIDKLIVIDQAPIGRGPRSTPATYTGLYDEIRKVFAQTREAKVRGYGASRFSFNVKGGRCETCEGQGVRRIEMNFLPDQFVRCEQCGGLRFNRQTLEARFKGRSIGEVLTLRVDEGREVFDAQPKIRRGLDALHEAGLGYLTLGQSSTTLSGGESQRVKLAAELGRSATGRTLYVLDEPTTGLHFADVARLLIVLRRLADLGNTVLVIEHNLDVLRSADWLIDLGPGGGPTGGHLLAAGPPRSVAANPESLTGRYLRPSFEPAPVDEILRSARSGLIQHQKDRLP